jgi:hypothetical protein
MTVNEAYERERKLMIGALPASLTGLVVEGSSLMKKIESMCMTMALESVAVSELSSRYNENKTALHDIATDMCISTGVSYRSALETIDNRLAAGESLSYLSGLYSVGRLTYRGLLHPKGGE